MGSVDGVLELDQGVAVQAELVDTGGEVGLVEHAEHDLLAVDRRQNRDAQIEIFSRHAHAHAAVLRQPALGDVEVGHDLDARDHRRGKAFRRRLHIVQHAVDAVPDGETVLERLDVDVGRAHVEGVRDQQADQADDRRFRREVLQLLHVGVEGEFVDARFDVADHLALRRLAGAVQALQRSFEFRGNGDHRPHGAPGHHRECADRVFVGRVRHRERHLGVVFAQRQRPRLVQEAGTDTLLEDRKLGIARRIDQRQRELRRQRLGDVTLRDHAERHQQRAQPFAGLLLQAQSPFKRRRIELATLDQNLAYAFAYRNVHARKGLKLKGKPANHSTGRRCAVRGKRCKTRPYDN